MSDLTLCNHCSLENISHHASEEGARVRLRAAEGEMEGWIAVWRSDEEGAEPVAYFLELTTECVC